MRSYIKYLSYLFILISVKSVLQWSSLATSILNNTTFWWIIFGLTLYILYKLRPKEYKIPIISFFLILVCISFLYGATFMTRNYWDWKLLIENLMIFLLPLSVYVFSIPKRVEIVLGFWYNKAWIVFLILWPFLYSDAYANFLVPYVFIGLFFPLLNYKWKAVIILVFFITFFYGWASRSCLLRLSVAIILGLIFCSNSFIFIHKIIKPLTIIFWLIPIIFFILGITGTFNVFNIDEELELSTKYEILTNFGEDKKSFAEDTRTPVYKDILSSAIQGDYYIFGHSIARGYKSYMFGEQTAEALGGDFLEGERPRSEISILNVFTYMGILGFLLYMFIFICSSYLAVFCSKNKFLPVIGLFVAFRWLYGWIEDFSLFNLNYFLLWIMIGICFSPIFRSMSNNEFKEWIYLLLSRKNLKYYNRHYVK